MAAIWGRWVTQSTCFFRATWAIFSATFWAARPDTPVSTSSKTRLSMPSSSASTFFSASMMRASSPPEATFWMGLRASPTLADMRNCTSSPPVSSSPQAPSLGANSTWKRTLGMSSWRSSSCTRVWRASAARLRAWESPPARLAASSLAFSSFWLRRAMVSSAYWIWSSSWRLRSR